MKRLINCGWEDECDCEDCLKCPRKWNITIPITHAEATCVEDFAVVDLDSWGKMENSDRDLSQDIIRQLMFKIFKEIDE